VPREHAGCGPGGSPNVGKSALFNRIVGHDTAIVSEEAGTTRDRHFARAEWQGRAFFLVDTGGITDDPRAPLDAAIRKQVEAAIAEADLLLMVVDGKGGLHPIDRRVADMLRHSGKPFILVVKDRQPVRHNLVRVLRARCR
jgi:GTP-binding protein